MDNNLIKEKHYVDKTNSDRNEIRIRSNDVCNEQVIFVLTTQTSLRRGFLFGDYRE